MADKGLGYDIRPQNECFLLLGTSGTNLILPVSEGSILSFSNCLIASQFHNCEFYYTVVTLNAVSVQFTLVGILVFQRGLCYHTVRETTRILLYTVDLNRRHNHRGMCLVL